MCASGCAVYARVCVDATGAMRRFGTAAKAPATCQAQLPPTNCTWQLCWQPKQQRRCRQNNATKVKRGPSANGVDAMLLGGWARGITTGSMCGRGAAASESELHDEHMYQVGL